MKKLFTLMLVVLVGLTVACGKKDEDKKPNENTNQPSANTNEGVIGDKELEAFKFENTSFVTDEKGETTLITQVTNTSSETIYLKSFNIIVKAADGSEMLTLIGYIGEEVPAGEVRMITSTSSMSLADADSIEYTINK